MGRFFVTPEDIDREAGLIRLTDPEDLRHLVKVLRAREGERVTVSDGISSEYAAHIAAIDRQEVILEIESEGGFTTELPYPVDLYQGMPKHGKMDLIVQKTVETGVRSVIPVFMERSIPGENKNEEKRTQRLRKIALGAAKQSGRGLLPTVETPVQFEQALAELSGYDLVLFLYEDEEGLTIRDALEQVSPDLPEDACAALVVGPEGGFSAAEAEALQELPNCRCVTLGPRILRTETAAIAALAQLSYCWEL